MDCYFMTNVQYFIHGSTVFFAGWFMKCERTPQDSVTYLLLASVSCRMQWYWPGSQVDRMTIMRGPNRGQQSRHPDHNFSSRIPTNVFLHLIFFFRRPCHGQHSFFPKNNAHLVRYVQCYWVVSLRTFAALSRAALLRDGHADLSFIMTVWIGLVTAGNSHFVGNLLLELRPKSLEKIPKVIIF